MGQERVTSHFKSFITHMKPEIESDVFRQKGKQTKYNHGQNLPDKSPWTKPPEKTPAD